MDRLSFIGMGYVGLCTAVCFAGRGYETFLSTKDKAKADSVNKGVPPFYEPALEQMLRKTVNEGYLKAVLGREEAISQSNITFITVGTPSRADGKIDLRFVRSAAQEIGRALKKKADRHVVVVKSTVVPGTTENVVKQLLERNGDKQCGRDFSLCFNPEFLREGSGIHDTLNPDRIIIGEYDEKSGDAVKDLYRNFYGDKMPPMIRTNLSTAELIKYASNASLATKISLINTIANICEKVPKADVVVVAKGIGLDKRIGSQFLNAGLGYGGSCFPKDIKALIAFSKHLGYNPTLLNAVEEVNKIQPYKAVELCKTILGNLQGKRVAILGLAFKPNTDDMREAVSVKIINNLLEEGANVVAYDPAAIGNTKRIFENKIEYTKSAIECIKNADCCIIVTEWDEFKTLEPEDFLRYMKKPVLIDGRRIYNPTTFREKVKFLAVGLANSSNDSNNRQK